MIGAFVRSLAGLPERRALPGAAPAASLGWDDWLGVRSPAGVTVTPDSALGVTTVMACVTLIARSLASVPLVLYQRQGDTGRRPAQSHPLYAVLHDLANPILTAFDVRQALFACALLYGNAYAEIEWGDSNAPVALWPLPPQHVTMWVTPRREWYYTVTENDGKRRPLLSWQVHHLRGLVTDGWLGLSPLRAANAIGLAMAAEQFGARYFGSGAAPSMVLSHPGKLTPEAMRNLRASFENQWSGLGNAHRLAVMAEGVKPEAFDIRADEAQMLETRAFQVAEICRIFNVSPGLVGAAETQTYASAEQDLIRFRELTLGPWAEEHEKAILRDLLKPSERDRYFAQYKLSKLQATDLKTRYEAHQIAVLSGLETPNERRVMEDLNPIDGGDDLWMPLNMGLARHAAQASEPAAVVDASDAQRSAMAAWVADVRRRLDARIANDVRQAGAKALRQGGRAALSEWGETQQIDWRTAGEEMLAPAQAAGDVPRVDVSAWVSSAYQSAVAALIAGE